MFRMWRSLRDENARLVRMEASNTQRIARLAARRDELVEAVEWEHRQRVAAEALAERLEQHLVTAQQTIEILRHRIDGTPHDGRLTAAEG